MINEASTKMVCIMRKDLRNSDGNKLPKGKLIAQGGHAYVGLVSQILKENNPENIGKLNKWLASSFVKVALEVDSLEELLEIYEKASVNGLNTILIKDNGHTEFAEPTITCIGIGPDNKEKIDSITGHLKSYR